VVSFISEIDVRWGDNVPRTHQKDSDKSEFVSEARNADYEAAGHPIKSVAVAGGQEFDRHALHGRDGNTYQ